VGRILCAREGGEAGEGQSSSSVQICGSIENAQTDMVESKKRKAVLDSDGEERPDADEAVRKVSAVQGRGSMLIVKEKSSNASSAEEDAEYEDESDHQDYDANYFDNGEGDDDEGGEDGESDNLATNPIVIADAV
jgi:hypothetical protein